MTTTPGRRRRAPEAETVEAFVADTLGLSASVAQVVAVFREVRDWAAAQPESDDAGAEFPPDERAALERAGADFSALPAGTPDPVERTRIAFGALLLDTRSVDEVASRLGRDKSRVRQRIRDRSIWSLPADGGSRLPRVQFADDGSEIRGMGEVMQALPADLHPVAVLRWLTRPKPDLRIDDIPVSPRDWLLAGGKPSEAVALAEDLHA